MRYALVLLLACSFVMVGCNSSPEAKADKAQKCLDNGDFDGALEICKELLSDPSALDKDLQAKIAKINGDAMAKQAEAKAKELVGS